MVERQVVEGREWSQARVSAALRMPTASDDKYSRGVVGLRTGSDDFPGAAVLGVEAAWRGGAGMVRYLGASTRAREFVLQRRPETVTASGRVQSWVVGSGTAARAAAETDALREILTGDVPVVVDAGALDLAQGARTRIVVTPHDREHAALRTSLGLEAIPDSPDTATRVTAAVATADALERAGVPEAVVLLKGAVTIIATASGEVHTVTSGAPWLSTAGTGDVLAGILGALIAADADDLAAAAASAAWVHGRAGSAASARHAGGPLVALEVAEAAASVIGAVLAS